MADDNDQQKQDDEKKDADEVSLDDVKNKIKSPSQGKSVVDSIDKANLSQVIQDMFGLSDVASIYINKHGSGFLPNQEVVQNHTHVHGNVYADAIATGSGSIRFGTSKGGETNVGRVIYDLIEKVEQIYVPTQQYDLAFQTLSQQHLLVLRGKTNWGKFTTGIKMLTEHCDSDVFEISPDLKIKNVLSLKWKERSGYIIDTLDSTQVAELSRYRLRQLSNKLQESNSYLVIVLDSVASIVAESEIHEFFVVWDQLPSQDAVLETHLVWFEATEDEKQKISLLVKESEIVLLLSETLVPNEISRLAELMIRVVREELTIDSALAQFESRVIEQVTSWFREHKTLEDIFFYLTLAVLHGSTRDQIIDAEQTLQKASPNKRVQTNDEFFIGQTLEDRLTKVGAEQFDGTINTHTGISTVKRIKLRNPSLPPIILKHVWESYTRLREIVQSWFDQSVRKSPLEVRLRVAAAVGELSTHSFDNVVEKIISAWAKHEEQNVRIAAASALGIPIYDEHHAPRVLNLLHSWSRQQNNWRLMWTAGVAYGGLVGVRYPDVALNDLKNIVDVGDLRLVDVVIGSVAMIFNLGNYSPDYYGKVLVALLSWTDDKKKESRTVMGLLIFLYLSETAMMQIESDSLRWPTMLRLGSDSEDHRKLIIKLLRRSLNFKETQELAREMLESWFQLVDDDPQFYDALKIVLDGLVLKARPQEIDRLRYYVKNWMSQYPSSHLKLQLQNTLIKK